jgi:hypothetical protein
VCSHSERDATANAELILYKLCHLRWSKSHLLPTQLPVRRDVRHIERENDRPEDVPPCCGGKCRFQMRDLLARLTVIKCDQTTVWAIPKIVCREEVRRSLPGRVRFVLRGRLQHGNNLDCSTGAFSARRRGLGIFAVASLKWLLNKHGTRAV